MKKTRIIFISKEQNGNYYPELDKIRTIAIAPAITKFYKLCIPQKLNTEIKN
jgi:hypothetical protein